jgi:RNA polymerase sigma-70 factor (ECF subfamily)
MEQEIYACLDRKLYQKAFDLLLPEYRNKVFRLAYAMMGDATRAEDIAQEVFIRIWKGLAGYRGQSALSTWIYAITRNACLTALKTTGAKKEVSIEEPGIARAVEESNSAVRPPFGAEIDLVRLMEQLPEKQQQVLRLYYMEDKSYDEVARLLEWPMGTVKTYLHRARKQLAEAAIRSKMDERKA